ncbi:MAG: insulinase family protein [Bacteroidales bacterium]|nr:insulinase family protein [Bacteroidales bacterium]
MKKIAFFLSIVLISLFVTAQNKENKLKLTEYKLENGLSVYLNEDTSVPNVLGAVVIKTGGKYDPAEHTGTSHYLEHMMFKGTDELGTTDYKAEKLYLDSISEKYDELAKINDETERKAIQKKINELSLEAGKYAIPNELDRTLDQIGASMVDAFTSDEIVAYFNMFPNNQMEKWMMIYSHRFKYPVFRLFQSELETVFEEKNMYADNFATNLIETFYKNFYKNHPYGTQTVLGTSEHIKNPSLTNMRKMHQTYYVANNMALIITGNFNTDEVKPMIEKYFGSWKSGEIPEFPEYKEPAFQGIEKVVERLTPVKAGLIGYRTIPANHKDEIALEVATALLSNSSSTGYLDKLSIEGELLEAMCFGDVRNDHGAIVVLYVPKIIGQSHKKAFKIVNNEIMKLQTQDIDKELLEAVKLNMIKEHQQSLEDPTNRAFLIASLFTANKKWDEIINYPKMISEITAEDIKNVAEKYLNENMLSFQSKMGFPKKNRLEKPGFDPVIPVNTEAKSKFGKKLNEMPENKTKPNFVDFEKDITSIELKGGAKIYYVENKINDIFNLTIKFQKGTNSDMQLSQLAEYIQLIGTEKLELNEFNNQLQQLGCSFYTNVEDNYFTIYIDGFDSKFKESIDLITSLLKSPKADESKLKNIKRNASFGRKFESSSPDELASAMFNYGLYGKNSKYLRRTTVKEIKNTSSQDLLDLLSSVTNEKFSIHYSGSLNPKLIAEITEENLNFKTKESDTKFPVFFDRTEYKENTILFLDDPKSLQSRIYFYVDGEINNPEERTIAKAYNQYFGTGMSAIVFQEVREFRSMAYSAYAVYRPAFLPKDKGYLQAYVGTQCDKTIDAISLMDSLIHQMPVKENRMPDIAAALTQSINSSKPTWRNISEKIESWKIQGYKEDPAIIDYKVYDNLDFKQIYEFYENNIQQKPMLICIVGNKKNIDMDKLAKFGKIIELDKKDILN